MVEFKEDRIQIDALTVNEKKLVKKGYCPKCYSYNIKSELKSDTGGDYYECPKCGNTFPMYEDEEDSTLNFKDESIQFDADEKPPVITYSIYRTTGISDYGSFKDLDALISKLKSLKFNEIKSIDMQRNTKYVD